MSSDAYHGYDDEQTDEPLSTEHLGDGDQPTGAMRIVGDDDITDQGYEDTT